VGTYLFKSNASKDTAAETVVVRFGSFCQIKSEFELKLRTVE